MRRLPGSGGLGIMFNSDNEGIAFIKNTSLALVASVRIPITGFMISQLGIKAAYVQKRLNWEDFVFSDQLSAKYGNIYLSNFIPPNYNHVSYPDFAAGGILQFMDATGSVSGTLGLSVDHLFKPDESFLTNQNSLLPRKLVLHGDAVINSEGGSSSYSSGSSSALLFNPGLIYQSQGKSQSLSMGLNISKYNFYLGAWYKSLFTDFYTGAGVLLVGYRYDFTEEVGIRFAYSYDLPISTNLQGTGGAHEISLIFEFDSPSIFGSGGGGGRFGRGGGFLPRGSNRSSGAIECPAFF